MKKFVEGVAIDSQELRDLINGYAIKFGHDSGSLSRGKFFRNGFAECFDEAILIIIGSMRVCGQYSRLCEELAPLNHGLQGDVTPMAAA